MEHQQPTAIYHRARLPRSLDGQLKKIQIIHVMSGTLMLIMGGVTMGVNETNSFIVMVTAGVATLFSSWIGIIATLKRSIVLHAACLGVTIFTTYIGLTVYNFCVIVVSAIPYNGDLALVLVDLFIIVFNLIINTLVIGVQSAVLYVSNKKPEKKDLVAENNIETAAHTLHR